MRRAVMVASAISYIAMAWLVLTHSHDAGDAFQTSSKDLPAHAAHLGGVAVLPGIAIAVLIVVLLVLFVMSLRRGRRVLAVETGAMAAMLLVMVVPGLLG